MKKSLILLLMLLAISSHACGASLTYPALGNIDLGEGTIEAWVILEFDPVPTGSEKTSIPFSFLKLQSDPDNYLWLLWRIQKSNTGPYATSKKDGNKFTPNWGLVKGWSKGEKHHIAFCWKPDKNWWIIDGKKVREVKQSLQHAIAINERLNIVFGGRRAGRVIIDDLRISSVARAESEVGFHRPGGLKIDPFTLLLDTFDKPFKCDGTKKTKAKVMIPSAAQTGGMPDKKCKFVSGIKGTGLEL